MTLRYHCANINDSTWKLFMCRHMLNFDRDLDVMIEIYQSIRQIGSSTTNMSFIFVININLCSYIAKAEFHSIDAKLIDVRKYQFSIDCTLTRKIWNTKLKYFIESTNIFSFLQFRHHFGNIHHNAH